MSNASDAMQALQRKYRATLADRIKQIYTQFNKLSLSDWQWADLAELHHQIHSLTGSAGTFGLQSLSNAASQLEVRIKNWLDAHSVPNEQDWTALADELKCIDQLTQNLLKMEAPNLKPRPNQAIKNNLEPRLYLLEDDEQQANHMALALQEDGFKVEVFGNVASFRSALSVQCPDAVVLDLILAEGEDAGLSLLADMKAEQNCHVPVVCVSVRDDFDARIAAYRAGASRYMHKPVQPEALIGVLNSLTGRLAAEPYRVVLVDDDEILLEVQSYILESSGMEVKALTDPSKIFDTLDRFCPDVLILDVYMPDVSGPELAAIIRERDDYLSLPILFLSAESDMKQQLQALSLGGDDFLVKPVHPEHLISAVTARARRARQSGALQNRLRNTLYEREREHLALNQHVIISIADRQGTILDVNDKCCQISGYSRKELLGQNHRMLKSSQHPPEFYEDLWRTISQGRVWQGRICNRAKDGSLYWVESTITPFLDEDGKPYQYVSIRTDITRQLLSEQAVEEAKERLRRGQMFAKIGTWEWNIVSGELFWTEQIAPLFGYPEGDLATTYDNFVGALHPDDRQKVIDAFSACIEEGAPYDIEHRVVWPDGTVRWLLEKGDVQRDAEGKPTKMLGVVQDIHVRKLAEMELAEREGQLLEAQRLANIGNWHANLQTGELFWSDQVYKIFGYEPGSFTPSVEAFHAAVHPDDTELLRQSETKAEQTGRHDVTHRIVRPDGAIRYVHELAEMQLDDSGTRLSMTGTLQDVTEIQLAKQEAERANRAKSDFLSSMSHELRTPLNAIIGFSQLLELSDLSDKQKGQLQTIATSGKHLLSLINDVLEFAKLESSNLSLNIETVEVQPIIEQVIALTEPHAYKENIQIDVADLDTPIFIQADPVRFKQVLLNLMTNGIKYNRPHGKLSLTNQTREHNGQKFWQLDVTDTGLGIAQQDLPRLFEPFDRLGHEGSTIEGTGIGLSITKDLVEQMQGLIEVTSEVNVGTTFSVSFPLDENTHHSSVTSAVSNPGPIHQPEQQTPAFKLLKVLCVEDNPANMKLMAQVGQLIDGIELRVAPSAENGLQQAEAWLPQLILLDINLPGMNGDEAITHFRALPGYQAQAPLIYAVTANVLEQQVARYRELGFDEIIAKPFELAQVVQQIEVVRDGL
ncbi:MAG: PAS domain-containing protein [Methyloprofundus sp.]|nr:PAS domain-containing protein [Methyloprofundus sp.]